MIRYSRKNTSDHTLRGLELFPSYVSQFMINQIYNGTHRRGGSFPVSPFRRVESATIDWIVLSCS